MNVAIQHPEWFWAFLSLPFMYFIFRCDHRSRLKSLSQFADQSMWSMLSPEFDPKARTRKTTIWLLAVAFFILAAARPQWGKQEELVRVSGMDIYFVLDVSNSMEAEDIPPSRLKEAKHVIRRLVQDLANDRIGLILFAASNYLAVPLTTDHTYFLDMLSQAGPKSVVNQGTDIGLALETAAKALERGAEDPTAIQSKDTLITKAVVLITDGEDQEEQLAGGAKRLKEVGASFFVIGIGTEKGAPVPVRDDSGVLRGYKKDRSGTAVISQFRAKGLSQAAEAAGGKFWKYGSDADTNQILDEMLALNRTDFNERRVVSYVDRFQIPLFIGILLLLFELSIPARRIKFAKIAVFLLAIGCSFNAYADVPIESYLETEKGVDAYEKKNVEEARKHFGNAQAHQPSSPHLNYNQGVIALEQEDFKNAERIFEESANGAEAAQDPNLAGRAYYNLGESQFKNGKPQEAVRSYLSALDYAKRTQNEALETNARRKLENLVQQQKQKSQSKDGNQGESKDKDPKEQNSDQQSSQSGDKKDKENEGQEDQKQFKETPKSARKEQFKSQKLSKEDADRVMQELGNKEEEAMKRYKNQKGTRDNTNDKDW